MLHNKLKRRVQIKLKYRHTHISKIDGKIIDRARQREMRADSTLIISTTF